MDDKELIQYLLENLHAIKARIDGEFGHPALMNFGELSSFTDEDVYYFAEEAIEKAAHAGHEYKEPQHEKE
jgi:hypothetical protein